MAEATGSCPICGVTTVGHHIAGSVYDFQCEVCVDEVEEDFTRFVAAVLAGEFDEQSGERSH